MKLNKADIEVTFEEFAELSRGSALRMLASRLKGDSDTSEDLLIEVLLDMHATWGDTLRRSRKECWSFLRKGIGWAVLNHARRRKAASLDELYEESGYEPSVEVITDSSDSAIMLRGLLGRLQGFDRLLVEMDAEEYSLAEIAGRLGLPLRAVRPRLKALHAWMAGALQGGEGPPPEDMGKGSACSAQRAAAIVGRRLYWVLVRLKLLGVSYVLKPTQGTYAWPHVTGHVVRRLARVSKRERFVGMTALTGQELEALSGDRDDPAAWLTSKRICFLLNRSEGWVRRRLVPFLGKAEFRCARNGGGVWLHFPPEAYSSLKAQAEAYPEAGGWKTVGGMADALGRHVKWVEWRLPALGKKLGIRPEERLLPDIGRRAACWPPEAFDALRKEAERVPDKEEWVSVNALRDRTGKDWSWVKAQLDAIGSEPRDFRIPGSGKISPHYSPEDAEEVIRRAGEVTAAPRGWLTADGLEGSIGKSHSWIAGKLKRYGAVESGTYGDHHMVPRTFYGPAVVRRMRKEAAEVGALPPKGDHLAVMDIAEALGKSQGWTRKQILLQKIEGSRRINDCGHVRTYYDPSVVELLRWSIPKPA